ncbi:ATP-binding cassette domain-containing protein [Caldalkalibacillus mannanilyticus]|uniref:ATP-binding cassette domain-containing protein n=1 Tax=Caldalkalibacillus mannanilyticus TaxID=1418 RepID=UPI000685C354|nr:ATP-binding cassette domain-containing protein [Caldalkalibacillus mannanilyticus]
MNLHCLELKNVSKKVGKTEILRNISLEVRRGEIMGLLGPNGAGKTTLMRLIVQLSKLSKGNIYIDGLDVTEHFEQAMQKVGVIIESPICIPS